MKFRRIAIPTVAIALAASVVSTASAQEAGAIELQTVAQKELRIAKPDGGEEVKLVSPGKVIPGDRVAYTIIARNISEEPVERVVITDPIPEHMTYVEGTAGPELGGVLFSVDGGMRFDTPEKLSVIGADGSPRRARARDYTHVRFVFEKPLPPAAEREVRFVAQLD